MKSLEDLDIVEHFAFEAGCELLALARTVARNGAIFVEVGSWKGHSTVFLGKVAKECNGNVFCVDHWKGSIGVKEHGETENCLEIFRNNMKTLGLDDCVHPLVMESVMAARIFADGIADLIFIDADHRYAPFSNDLDIWWPKVKSGGILCGHDCEAHYSDCSKDAREAIDQTLDIDFNEDLQCHSGVVKAMGEHFKDYTLLGQTMWYTRRNGANS